jgi:hypothetical protein
MTAAFDKRIIEVGLELEPNQITTFRDLGIIASGTKFASPTQAVCTATIFNMTRDQRNYLLEKASFIRKANYVPKQIKMTLSVGRESYGTFLMFEGFVYAGLATQPPDIGITLTSYSNSAMSGLVMGLNQSGTVPLKKICEQVAAANQVTLDFQATDKNIDNFTFSGSPSKLIAKIEQCGQYEAFIDRSSLIVKDVGIPLSGQQIRLVNAQTGMVGIPEVNEWGVRVKMMIDNTVSIGSPVRIESEFNPGANGDYYIYKLDFHVANRENPFYYVMDCRDVLPGSVGE